MAKLFHVTEQDLWDAAQARGRYEMSTRGRSLADEGFIHCSLRHQIRGVIERFYADLSDLILLTIDEDLLAVPVRYEPPAPGVSEEFPHIYGPIPIAAVSEVQRIHRTPDGNLTLASA
ncbi:DUF952 domain-containing protein [Pseudonocardiaceae bacterium YIM PH 21723]|nr:DUF952 domain-containing protein [Pseudonocardiaceae bacterium YIM PH 21723]